MRFPEPWKRVDASLWVRFVVLYAILANIPFWFAKYTLGFFHQGWFCVEYACVGLLALYLPRILSAILLFLVIAADMICAVCETFDLSPSECIANFTSLNEFSGLRFLTLSMVFLLTFLVIAFGARLPLAEIRRTARGRTAACLLVFIGTCVLVDGATLIRRDGRIPNPFKPSPLVDAKNLSYYGELRLTRRTSVRLVTLYLNDARLDAFMRSTEKSTASLPGASAVALDDVNLSSLKGTAAMPNIVLVLLESWGQTEDTSIENALIQPYLQPAVLARYDVKSGTVAFAGPTLGGEGRELCGDHIGFGLMTASSQSLKSCLPDRLAALGYHSTAVHGLDGHMFKREDWYPRIGFDEELFREQFRQLGLPQCIGAFTGICDAAISQWIGQRLAVPDAKPDFIYWMTLNSHLPLPVPAPLKNGAPCSVTPLLAKNAPLCSWYQLIANVHDSVAQVAMSGLHRPTVFIIVGDHAPPFASPELRAAFSSAVVPYVILLPRASAQGAAHDQGAAKVH